MMTALAAGTSAGGHRGGVRLRPTRRQLEDWLIERHPGLTRSKANRLARQSVSAPDPFAAAAARVDLNGRLGYADPTGNTAVGNVMRGRASGR